MTMAVISLASVMVLEKTDAPTKSSGLYYKQVTIIIYDRNDSGQYYKTTITIIIDDRQLRL
jgi:hypothetical protein